jgi:uncharacterized protein YcbK (DUF882 family)
LFVADVSGKEGACRPANGSRLAAFAFCFLAVTAAPNVTESAIANGDTRTLTLSNGHTDESGSFTYMVNGSYDMAVLEKLNWFLRDWRLNESIKMDPKLFDILWEVYRESGSAQPIDVLSAYRSPQTNAMLRRRSRQVAEHSQHMEGRAIDAHFLDIGTASIRDIAMRLQAGGVGFYPVGLTPWVHIDSGAVRYWPRMTRDSMARLFPDGKTVFIPADGQPMPGYDLARAEIEARGGDVLPASAINGGGLFAWLFGGPHGGGSDDAEESGDGASVIASSVVRGRAMGGSAVVAVLSNAGPQVTNAASAPTAPQSTAPVADVDQQAKAADNPDVSLRGPIAAEFIAPLPPRKPKELIDLTLATAPLPPSRPQELNSLVAARLESRPPDGISPQPTPNFAHDNRDLILALLKRGQMPEVITRGIKGLPRDALALVETQTDRSGGDSSAMIARAASLSAPLPPGRPRDLPGPSTERVARAGVAPHIEGSQKDGFDAYGSVSANAFGNRDDSPAARLLKAKALASAQ